MYCRTMKISKTSWHYKIYNTMHWSDETTNLCSYVQTVVGCIMGKLANWFGIAVMGVIWTCVSPFIAILVLLHGLVPTRWSIFEPKLRKYAPLRAFGLRMYPAHILTPLCAIWIMSLWYGLIPLVHWQESTIALSVLTFLTGVTCGAMCYLSYVAANDTLKDFPKEETKGAVGLLYEYAKAKKNRVCPLVTFVDPGVE